MGDPRDAAWQPYVDASNEFLGQHAEFVSRVEALDGHLRVAGTDPSSFWLLVGFDERSQVSNQDIEQFVTTVPVKLFLNHSMISDIGVTHLVKMERLQYLSLRGTSITDDAIVSISNFSSLEGLSLAATNVTDINIHELAQLKSLISLRLSECSISDTAVVSIASMEQLEELWLDNTHITDKGVELLSRLRNLRFLSVSGTQLSDLATAPIAKLQGLERLHIEDTEMSSGGMAELRAFLPNCHIVGP